MLLVGGAGAVPAAGPQHAHNIHPRSSRHLRSLPGAVHDFGPAPGRRARRVSRTRAPGIPAVRRGARFHRVPVPDRAPQAGVHLAHLVHLRSRRDGRRHGAADRAGPHDGPPGGAARSPRRIDRARVRLQGRRRRAGELRRRGEEADAEKLMRAFVGKLEESGGLEDGVDVADSYASIVETIKPLADKMLLNVKANYERNLTSNNKRGTVIYNLLHKLFLSADTNNHIDLSKEFGIPPVYGVPFKALANDTGRVVMQVFFYGDKDGLGIFQGFKRLFDPKLWKITTTKNCISINSIKGKPVSIYANLPLPEENDLDKKAQDALDTFLLKNNLYPTVVIHRGHSYNAPYTIDQIMPSAKIVFMGSCGGYYLIHDILKHSPDAHIITSKQIGKTAVNQPFFNLLMEKVRNGNNIDWIPFWEELEKKVKVEGFEDYIPPYKNLGAIFIKAYKKAMGDED